MSIRILLGGLAAVLALPELLRNLGAYLKKPVIWLTVIFAVAGVLRLARHPGGNRMDVLITDVKGFMWLLLVPVLVATVRSRQRLRVLLSWVLAGAVIQAAVILAVNAGVVLMDDPAPSVPVAERARRRHRGRGVGAAGAGVLQEQPLYGRGLRHRPVPPGTGAPSCAGAMCWL